MPASKTALPTGSGPPVALRPRSSGGVGPRRPFVEVARSRCTSSFHGRFPSENLLFLRALRSRHPISVVQQPACPQPAWDRRPRGLRKQPLDRRWEDQGRREPRWGFSGKRSHLRDSLLQDRKRRQGDPARQNRRRGFFLARGVRLARLPGPPRPLCPVPDSGRRNVRGKRPPWPFSNCATPQKAKVFADRYSPHPAAAGFLHSLLAERCSSRETQLHVGSVLASAIVWTWSFRTRVPREVLWFSPNDCFPRVRHEKPQADGPEPPEPGPPDVATSPRRLWRPWPFHGGGSPPAQALSGLCLGNSVAVSDQHAEPLGKQLCGGWRSCCTRLNRCALGPSIPPWVEPPPHVRGRPACGSAITRRLRVKPEVACQPRHGP
jgi:hypothetical protein